MERLWQLQRSTHLAAGPRRRESEAMGLTQVSACRGGRTWPPCHVRLRVQDRPYHGAALSGDSCAPPDEALPFKPWSPGRT